MVSTRILRDHAGSSRGVGFARYCLSALLLLVTDSIVLHGFRMETTEACDRIIEALKGGRLPGHSDLLQVKFADSGTKKKQSLSE